MLYRVDIFLLAVIALWPRCQAYYSFQTKIPNGQRVPHPCKPNYIWHGVGHVNPLGGGQRNPFGQDFASHGFQWGPSLCQIDSDRDGRTNGEELGDPDCVWTAGQVPLSVTNTTHPGVCDPFDSSSCQQLNSWVSCKSDEFECEAIKRPGVRNVTLRFPKTKVPAETTSHICFLFDLPQDQPYHLIASTAVIDNPNVVHHIAVQACPDTGPLMTEPGSCDRSALGCTQDIALWSVGMTGECFSSPAGFRVGKGAITRVLILFHWTNRDLAEDLFDSSGMSLFITPHLRPFDAGILSLAQMNMVIPPGLPSELESVSCSPRCTRKFFASPIYIMRAFNHMHYMGTGGWLQHIRNKKVLANLTNDDPYFYDSPHLISYDPGVEILPGDELRMICRYSSVGKNTTTLAGGSSFDEMCNGIITYYPVQSLGDFRNCYQWDDVDACVNNTARPGCSVIETLEQIKDTGMVDEVLKNCTQPDRCSQKCAAAVKVVQESDPCLTGENWEHIKFAVLVENRADDELINFVIAVDKCDEGSE